MPDRLLLINPQNEFTSFKKFEVLGLGYIAAHCSAAGYDVSIYDCNFRDPRPDAVADLARSGRFGMCGITTMVGVTANAIRIADAIRRRSSEPVIVLGGYSATFEYERILAGTRAVDFIIRGEGEQGFRALADALLRGGAHDARDAVPGLVRRSTNEALIVNASVNVTDLDSLPLPWRSEHLDAIGLASILSSRGCQALCSFCSIQEFGRLSGSGAIRCRSPGNVVDEIAAIHDRTGIDYFLFIDDNFFGSERFDRGRLQGIARGLIERGLDCIRFEVSTRSADLRLPELDALAEAGLSRVYIGLEAGSVSQLKRYRKGCTVARNVGAIEAVRSRGVGIDFGYIPFDPYLRPEELLESMRFLLDNDLVYPWSLNTITVSINPFPGTHLHDRAKADGLLRRYDDFNYFFEFESQLYGPRFNRILRYFKKKYIIGVVDRYANGKNQQRYVGPDLDALQPALRTLFALWIERVRVELEGESPDRIDARVNTFENALANVLNAHLQLNASSGCRHERSTVAALAALAQELAQYLDAFGDEALPGLPAVWKRPFAFERAYHELRDRCEGAWASAPFEWHLPDGRQGSLRIDYTGALPPAAGLFDVFVPIERRAAAASEEIPATLYLGSVTGSPSLDLIITDRGGGIAQRTPLHTGWTEVRFSGLPASIEISSPTPMDAPMQVRLRAPLVAPPRERAADMTDLVASGLPSGAALEAGLESPA
jgi:radical SAM superfamily enzyme YgiQ (UPF0313 family)